MRIGIDISQTVYEGTGVARFTSHMVQSLVDSPLSKSHDFVLFFSSLNHKVPQFFKELIEANKNISLVHWYIPPRALSYLWSHEKLRQWMPLPLKADAYISSDWAEPSSRIANKKYTIVHDLVFRKYPKTVDPVILDAQTNRLDLVANECETIFCDSLSTQNDLKQFYPNCKAKLVVNYPGVNEVKAQEASIFPYEFQPHKYFLSVGKLEPRKNIPFLIDAFTEFRKKSENKDFKLVIVGPKGWDVSEQKLGRENVHFLGSVSDADLGLLYKNATAFVYPTLYEGFGIPPIEAMLAGCPVILSNTSSLLEIADDKSVMYINPLNPNDLILAMERISIDEDLRKSLVVQGYENAKRFSWSRYAERIISEISTKQI